MPKLVDFLLQESIRGRNKEKTVELLKTAPKVSESYPSARRGRPDADEADLRSRAATNPESLLNDLGIDKIEQNEIPEQAIYDTIAAMLDGTTREEFLNLFPENSISLVSHPSGKKLGVRIPLTEVSQALVEAEYQIKKEYAYWLFCTIIAANIEYNILNDIKLLEYLKIGCSNKSYIIYLSRNSWDKIT